MKKTLTVNLGGIVFNIDEDAFGILKSYLDTIKGYFDTSEGRDEIMTDIESRIAEMLQDKLNPGKQVINSTDINEVIVVMGQPEDYITDDLEDEPTQSYSKSHSKSYTYSKRRLYRDTDENMIGGVASGIGYYFGMDPLWIRLAFVIAVFLGFSGFLIYIILWIIMPEARTPSEKLAMKGEPVTFDNIGKTVEEEIKNVKKKLNNLDENHVKRHRDNVNGVVSNFGNFVLSIIKFSIIAIGKILGLIFIIAGILVILSLFFGTLIPLNVMFFDTMEFSKLFFTSGADFWMAIIGIFILAGIPFIALIMAGVILLFGAKRPKYTGLALAGTWVIGLILAAIGGVSTGFDFSKQSTSTNVTTLYEITSDTLYFDLLDSKNFIPKSAKNVATRDYFDIRDGVLISEEVGVDILKTKSDYPEIEVVKTARGKKYRDADLRASSINYQVETDSSIIKVDPYFSITADDKWRDQEVKINLFLPVGKTIFIPTQFKYLLDDVDNYTETHDREMVDKYWTMTDSGLVNTRLLNIDTSWEKETNGRTSRVKLKASGDGIELNITDDEGDTTIKVL